MKKSTGKNSKTNGATAELQNLAEEVIKYIETQAKDLDAATLAKYAGIAVLVIYGLRKSNVLGSIAISIVTGIITKYLSDQMQGEAASK
jgi:hypothetical protein